MKNLILFVSAIFLANISIAQKSNSLEEQLNSKRVTLPNDGNFLLQAAHCHWVICHSTSLFLILKS
jgi:hypothetical protein